MEQISKIKLYSFYGISMVLAAVLVSTLLYLLSWPIMAELPLGIAIFIQLIAFSRYLFKQVILSDHISLDWLKNGAFFWLDSQEEQSNRLFEVDVSEEGDHL